MIIVCQVCNIEFNGKKKRKYCSSVCSAKGPNGTIERNKARRKYAEIPGLSRQQVYWRNNYESREKHNKRDRDKRFIVIDYLGAKCAFCGYDRDKRALVLDHINSDGKEDRKRLGSRIYRYYQSRLNEADGKLQVLCANCNLIKCFDNDEYNISRRVTKNK
jgi:hypothetical protein